MSCTVWISQFTGWHTQQIQLYIRPSLNLKQNEMGLNSLYSYNINSLMHHFLNSQILQLTSPLAHMLLSLCLSGCSRTCWGVASAVCWATTRAEWTVCLAPCHRPNWEKPVPRRGVELLVLLPRSGEDLSTHLSLNQVTTGDSFFQHREMW